MTVLTYAFIILYDVKKYKETVKDYGEYKKSYTLRLLLQCLPMVIYGLLFNYVSLYPRVMVENMMGAEILGYYASVATPALIIQTAATFIYNPLISLFAEYFHNNQFKKFNLATFKILGIIILIGFVGVLGSVFLGEWILSLLYGNSIIPYSYLFSGAIIVSTLIAIIWFLGMLLVIKRDYFTLILGSFVPLIITVIFTENIINSYNLKGINIILIIVYLIQIIIYLVGVLKNNKVMDDKVYYVRSTSIINDSRASKEITSLITNGYSVYLLGWDRDKRIKDYDNIAINDNKVIGKFFRFKANYGESKRTILGLFLYQFWLLYRLIKDNKKYYVIHACDFDCGFISNLVAILFNKKLVYDIYDYYTDSRPMPNKIERIVNKLENNIINNAEITIICGEWRKQQIKDANPKELIVIHNTPDIKFIKDISIIKSKSKKFKLAYVGILQDHRLIMEVVDKIKGNSNYEIHIGGFGIYESDLIKLSKEYDNVFFYGSLKYDEVLSLEKESDILFATYDPSIKNHKYSAPNKIYEAMALSKPIIVCENTGIDSIITKNNIGLVVKYDAIDFMNKLDKLRSEKKLLKDMGNNANRLYKEKYSWEKMENILLKEYKKIGKGN